MAWRALTVCCSHGWQRKAEALSSRIPATSLAFQAPGATKALTLIRATRAGKARGRPGPWEGAIGVKERSGQLTDQAERSCGRDRFQLDVARTGLLGPRGCLQQWPSTVKMKPIDINHQAPAQRPANVSCAVPPIS